MTETTKVSHGPQDNALATGLKQMENAGLYDPAPHPYCECLDCGWDIHSKKHEEICAREAKTANCPIWPTQVLRDRLISCSRMLYLHGIIPEAGHEAALKKIARMN